MKIIDEQYAKVVVERGTACGGNCGSCETCMYANELEVTALNTAAASVGDRVTISSSSSHVIGVGVRVYVLPLLTFLLGYAAASILKLGQNACIVISIAAFFVGVAGIVWYSRRKNTHIDVEITEILH